LRNEPEVSLAIALGDHNFGDLKEFALGNTSASGNVHDIHKKTSYSEESQSFTATQGSDSVTSMIIVPPKQSALSLAHILNPISDNLDELQDHPEMCPPLDKLPSTDEHIDAPLDGMMVDLLLLTASSSFQALDKVSMEIDEQESGGVKGATLSKKSGLLRWVTVGAGKKRTQKDAEISSLNDSESESSAKKTSKRKKSAIKKLKSIAGAIPGPGVSRSATASRELRKTVQNGTFKPNPQRLERWKKAIKKLDKEADTNDKTAQEARHSICGRWYKGKEPYDTYRFRKHVNEECSSSSHTAGAGTPTVTQWQEKFNVNVHGVNDTEPKRSLPCPGVTKNDDARVTTYLGQTGAIGGGARSVTAIARERFRKLFSRLSRKHKQEVLDTQMHEQTW
jgi:hypothetical protein